MSPFHEVLVGWRLSSRRHAASTALVALSLALGLGFVAAVTSLMDGLGFRPVGIPDAQRLTQIFRSEKHDTYGTWSHPEYVEVQRGTSVFSEIAAYGLRGVGLRAVGQFPESLMAAVVSKNFFSTIQVSAVLGRTFVPDDDQHPTAPAAIVSYRLWQSRFGADPRLVGSLIHMNAVPCTIVGILPQGFGGIDPQVEPDVYIPISAWPSLRANGLDEISNHDAVWFRLVARLRPEKTIQEAQLEVATVTRHLDEERGLTERRRTTVLSLPEARRRFAVALAPVLLFGAALAIVIAYANAAALLLVQVQSRKRDVAIRIALGATPWTVFGQTLVQCVLVGALGFASAVAVATPLIRLLPHVFPSSPIPMAFEFRLDARVIALTAVVSLAASAVLAVGLIPAIRRTDVNALIQGRPGSLIATQFRRVDARGVVVTCQVALTLALLVLSAQLSQALWNLSQVDLGFERQPMLLVTVGPGVIGYDEQSSALFYESALQGLAMLPGIEAMTAIDRFPLSPYGEGAMKAVVIPGFDANHGSSLRIRFSVVGPRYFHTMGTLILRGRDFQHQDGQGPRVVAINRIMAERFWSQESPIGRMVQIGPQRQEHEIIAVVEDGKYDTLTEAPTPHMFFPLGQEYASSVTFVMRAAYGRNAEQEIRSALWEVDDDVPVMGVLTLGEHLQSVLHMQRVAAAIVTSLSAAGLLLAGVGVYGLVSRLVTCGVPEFAIRMALGCRPFDLVRQAVFGLAKIVVFGVAVGNLLAVSLGRTLAHALQGVGTTDARALLAGSLVLLLVAGFASFVPASRLAKLNPSILLR